MKSKKTIRRGVVALAALSLALAGCSTQIGGSDSGGDANALTVFWKGSEKAGIDAVVAKYQSANPNLKINVSTADVEQYQATIRTQLSAGTAPDVIFAWPANGNPAAIRQIAPGGYLRDLSDRPWVGKYPNSLKDLTSIDGKTYLMAPAVTSFGPWYNDNALKSAGLKAPSKWSDILPFCKAARSAGKVAYGLGAQALNNTQNPLYGLVPDLVYGADPQFDSQLESGATKFSSNDGWKTAMNRYQQMIEGGCFSDSSTGISQDQQNEAVAKGEAFGMFGIGFQLGALRKLAPDVDFVLHAFSGDDQTSTNLMTVSNAGGAAINVKAKNPDGALAFVDYLASDEGLDTYNAALAGTVPSIPTSQKFDDPNQQIITQYLADNRGVHFLNQFWPNARTEQAMYAGVQGMLAGSTTPSAVLSSMDAAYATK